MNIGNITSNNFNLDDNGKDMQIEVYEQLIEQLQQKIDKAIEELTYMSTDAYVEDYDIKDKYWELLLEILTSFTDKTIENTRKILRGGGDNE